jgi:hypothetical protein
MVSSLDVLCTTLQILDLLVYAERWHFLSEISGSHGNKYEDDSLLGYGAM